MRAVNFIAVVGALLIVGNVHAADTKVSGFVDAQYHWKSDGTGDGFTVDDGAVYINSEMGVCSATVDVPFQSKAASGAFSIATNKMQAYVGHKYNMGVGWKMGQYDTPFGLEANDANNRVFVRKGIVGTNILPVVQTGVLIDYAIGGTKLNLLVGNEHDKGTNPAGGQPEFGAVVNMAFGSMNLDLGFLGQSKTAGMTYLIDAVLKYGMGQLNIGVEFAMKNDPTSPTSTAPGASANSNSQMGIGALIGFAMTDTMSLDARFGYLSKATVGAGTTTGAVVDSAMDIAVGPSFAMSKALKCALQYTMMNSTTGGTSTTSHMGTISSIYSF
ncbi:MAG: hypothetical protein HYR96_15840 [Deltaproteobacteria bacterium]|nr:hypothetical protein [Deltaproteobacteria bacterium]MBI3294464.1 hypothetical protein [Deltaproteobacteria bacterium]